MGNPKKCIFIGDGGHDELYGAHKAGMKTIKVEWFTDRKETKIYLYTDYCVKRKERLKEVLKEINNT